MENLKQNIYTILFAIVLFFVIKIMFFSGSGIDNSVVYNEKVSKETKTEQQEAYNTESYLDNLVEQINENRDNIRQKYEEPVIQQNIQKEEINIAENKNIQTDDVTNNNDIRTQEGSFQIPDEEETQNQEEQNQEEIKNQEYFEALSETMEITTQNKANKKVSFYFYVPSQIRGKNIQVPYIVWLGALNDDGYSSLPKKLLKFADEKGFAVLAPNFKHNDNDYNKKESYQFPQAWSGEALINMLNKTEKQGIKYKKLYLAGFSAGAAFVSRFSYLYPDIVEACAILSSDANITPQNYSNVKYFYGIGINDNPRILQFAEDFNTAAQNLGMPIVYNKYLASHSKTQQEIDDVVDFFKNCY